MSAPETTALDAMAKVTCCPYGKCQKSRSKDGCRSHLYLVSAQMKLDGLARMGLTLKETA